MAYLFLAIAFTLNATANILLKIGSAGGINLSNLSPLRLLTSNWELLAGLVLFSLNVVFYFLSLRSLPLSIAYPIMVAMGFIIVNGYALFVLHETVTPVSIAGYFLIVLGLILVVSRQV